VALANKNARIAWAIMVRGERYKEPKLLLAAWRGQVTLQLGPLVAKLVDMGRKALTFSF
jgi:hypothetical protein